MTRGSVLRFGVVVCAMALTGSAGVAVAAPDHGSHGRTVAAIWAVNDGEKVDRDDLANPYKRRNSVWDGRDLEIFGARNEIVSFQVVVESGSAGIEKLTAALPELRRGRHVITSRPPADDPTQYAGRDIQAFGEGYLDVTKRTNADWIVPPDSPSEPADPLGPTPVQLIPSTAKKGLGGFPLTVAPRSNQAFWFDVYVPKDAKAGTYRGTVTVRADRIVKRLPISLRVYDVTLPDENSLTAMIYYEPSQVERYQGHNLDPAFHRFAHRNRVEFVHGYDIPTATAALARFRGTDFTPANGYDGPGVGVGNTLVPRTFYGPGPDFDTPEEAAANARPWTDWLGANLPDAETFVYMPDEPSPEEFPYIRSIGEAVHSSGAPLPVFVSHTYDAELDGPNRAIDIWGTVADLYSSPVAAKLRAEGRDMHPYNGQRPQLGSALIDSPATDPRATIWACFKHRISRYFYWHANHWRHNGQANPAWERDQNVWADPITFFNRRGFYANGDGVLVYPGEEVLHPAQDRGVPGPIGTIQLASYRRGLQDHQYLTMARAAGLSREVEKALATIVPRVMDDTTTAEPVSYPEHGDAFERVRLHLLRALERSASAR